MLEIILPETKSVKVTIPFLSMVEATEVIHLYVWDEDLKKIRCVNLTEGVLYDVEYRDIQAVKEDFIDSEKIINVKIRLENNE